MEKIKNQSKTERGKKVKEINQKKSPSEREQQQRKQQQRNIKDNNNKIQQQHRHWIITQTVNV